MTRDEIMEQRRVLVTHDMFRVQEVYSVACAHSTIMESLRGLAEYLEGDTKPRVSPSIIDTITEARRIAYATGQDCHVWSSFSGGDWSFCVGIAAPATDGWTLWLTERAGQ